MKFLVMIVGLFFTTSGFSQGFLDQIKEKVGSEAWDKIPRVQIKLKSSSHFEAEYPGFAPSEIPESGIMLFTLPSGRKGLAFRYDILGMSQISSLYLGSPIVPKNTAVVESIFQRYKDSEYNFAPSGGVRWYLGTAGGCGQDTIDRVATLISQKMLQTKDGHILIVK